MLHRSWRQSCNWTCSWRRPSSTRVHGAQEQFDLTTYLHGVSQVFENRQVGELQRCYTKRSSTSAHHLPPGRPRVIGSFLNNPRSPPFVLLLPLMLAGSAQSACQKMTAPPVQALSHHDRLQQELGECGVGTIGCLLTYPTGFIITYFKMQWACGFNDCDSAASLGKSGGWEGTWLTCECWMKHLCWNIYVEVTCNMSFWLVDWEFFEYLAILG